MRSDDVAVAERVDGRTAPSPVEADAEGRLERRVKLLTSVLAPTTVLTALLFYYGYVATTAEYGHFGINLGSLGLSNQEFLLRSAATLFLPVGALLFAALFGVWGHIFTTERIRSGSSRGRLRIAAVGMIVVGLVAVGRGVVGVLVPSVSRAEPMALSPLCLGLGIGAVAYGRHLWYGTAISARAESPRAWPEQASLAIVVCLMILSSFWAANSFAAAYGRGAARVIAQNLDDRPAVVLDTTERLFARYPGIDETSLPPSPGQRFLYRYRGLRLLVESDGRMFLLPDRWRSGSGATLVVRNNENVRLQFYR